MFFRKEPNHCNLWWQRLRQTTGTFANKIEPRLADNRAKRTPYGRSLAFFHRRLGTHFWLDSVLTQPRFICLLESRIYIYKLELRTLHQLLMKSVKRPKRSKD